MSILIGIKIIVKELLGDSLLADYIRYIIIGLWITVAAPLLFNKIFRKSGSINIDSYNS